MLSAFSSRLRATVRRSRCATFRGVPYGAVGWSTVVVAFLFLASAPVDAQLRSSVAATSSGSAQTSAATGSPASSSSVLSRFAAPSEQFAFGPKEQTNLDITVSAASDVNADEKGRAAPILVRVYELKSEAAFETADYFSLQNNDKAVLGGDLLTREEFIFRPGDVRTIRRKSHPDLAVIAVLAGYRELARSDWRAIQKIAPAPESVWYRAVLPANKSRLQIELQTQGVRITAIE